MAIHSLQNFVIAALNGQMDVWRDFGALGAGGDQLVRHIFWMRADKSEVEVAGEGVDELEEVGKIDHRPPTTVHR